MGERQVLYTPMYCLFVSIVWGSLWYPIQHGWWHSLVTESTFVISIAFKHLDSYVHTFFLQRFTIHLVPSKLISCLVFLHLAYVFFWKLLHGSLLLALVFMIRHSYDEIYFAVSLLKFTIVYCLS